jgi:hypothetical protein
MREGQFNCFASFAHEWWHFPGNFMVGGLFDGKICAEVFFRESSILRKNSFVENLGPGQFSVILRARPKFSQSGFSYNTVISENPLF